MAAPGRAKFADLFADPRHARGDARMVRRAIRERRIPTQADYDALLGRCLAWFDEVQAGRKPGQSAETWARGLHRMIELIGEVVLAHNRARQYLWTRGLGGRPREGWHVSDYRDPIDANAVRRDLIREGVDPFGSTVFLTVTHGHDIEQRTDRIRLHPTGSTIGRWRLLLVCPWCGRRCRYLFTMVRGVRCRVCAGVGYDRRRPAPTPT